MNIAPTNQPMPKHRIGYIDALRGFTMLLVVCVHTATFSKIDTYPYSEFFILFRMPLFFFISGFILYKKDYTWNLSNTTIFLSKKFLVQIIPTAIFLFLYMFIFTIDRINGLYNGYWFTITLFEYFLVYSFSNIIFKKQLISSTILLILGIFLFITRYLSWSWEWYNINTIINEYIIWNFEYFIFFIIGTIFKKHFDWVCKYVFNNNIIMLFVVSLMLVGSIFYLNDYWVKLEVKLALSILGIFSIFYFFMKNSDYMDNSRVGKVLQFIGRRTLDIYLLHYFFVNDSISWVKNFNFNSSTIIFIISILTSFVIIGICLLISKFLRTNPLLGKILFGAKIPDKA